MEIAPTLFQKRVYNFVRTIPKGKTMSYAQVAEAIGRPRAYRAVGNALNRNPYILEVPCHRVIRSDGSIGGFNSGTARKKTLLRAEGAI
ncbi:MAG: 6-O-methylguanine DNA methyltransferase [Candidatus Yanofskybacteria bacterium RIFCSPHIGHO2_02_FULL_50_12]|uniref:methylated-DNA--[protein]-cysteine S-methyltransferase n=1 Tax=Candidatus Yanofskybacteria bacterium RIFCSPHIGHO2_02_FULL_50_12 TaxID=1802685 RepID=A0A1F8FVH0_9BACT|nr:MAG: 6-O-methylguanine DNA methyltransferase [Candidatus Yanofskybacteria bacterium RIFCSPHIGHO2_02_FULL_50_12]